MKRLFGIALVCAAASAAAQPSHARITSRGVAPFAQCFIAAQERAGRPWSFVPHENGGGTFSNAGAADVRTPYVLEVADRGGSRELRLSAGGDPSVARAVDRCA